MVSAPRRSRFSILTWTRVHRLTAAVFLLLLVLGRQTWFPWLKGSLTSTRLFGTIPFADPLAALEVMLASRGTTFTLLLGLGATVLIAGLLGRVFCGWLCPLGLVLDLCDEVNGRFAHYLSGRGMRVPRFDLSREWKYWLLAFCLLLSLIGTIPVFTTVSPVNLVALAAVFRPGPEFAVIVAAIAIEFFSSRAFCRSLCPLGAFYALLGRFAPLRIRVRQPCDQHSCRGCTSRCPMGILVFEEYARTGRPAVDDPECTRCGTCVDVCPGNILQLGERRCPEHQKTET